ncbi:MAG TPA: histone deacetylase [Candidatus Limnocylindrales bacterium]|nr:histone deacetylase [Candidatus Limnocylindrales bacterium]
MRDTVLLIDPRFRQHLTGSHHPERPERLEVLERLFATEGFADLRRLAPRAAEEEELRRVHEHDHVAAVAASAARAHTQFDADTPASTGSFEAARLAAGGAIAMADAILAGEADNGFAALRPPGHHAEAWRPMGFCLFNNVAVVARHLRQARGLDRVLIVDWDVHHGNGTQNTFYDDDSVMYVSTHQYPFYPGTGSAAEIGRGAGTGYNINVPMPAGAGDEHYYAAFRDLILPVARRFRPQFVLVSAGFDAHRSDPLASMQLSTEAFGEMTNALVEVADEHAQGRILLLLEGGYDLSALAASVERSVDALRRPARFERSEGELTAWGRQAAEAAAAVWDTE